MELQYDLIELLVSDASEEINGKNSFDEPENAKKNAGLLKSVKDAFSYKFLFTKILDTILTCERNPKLSFHKIFSVF